MKKIVILLAMIFISLNMAFSDDNLNKNENIFFPWQLFNYYYGNSNNDILAEYPFENNIVFKITLDDYIYSIDEPFGYYIYYTLQVFKFMDNISGGPERRHMEQIESNRKYNILNPTEPPRNTNIWKQ